MELSVLIMYKLVANGISLDLMALVVDYMFAAMVDYQQAVLGTTLLTK